MNLAQEPGEQVDDGGPELTIDGPGTVCGVWTATGCWFFNSAMDGKMPRQPDNCSGTGARGCGRCRSGLGISSNRWPLTPPDGRKEVGTSVPMEIPVTNPEPLSRTRLVAAETSARVLVKRTLVEAGSSRWNSNLPWGAISRGRQRKPGPDRHPAESGESADPSVVSGWIPVRTAHPSITRVPRTGH